MAVDIGIIVILCIFGIFGFIYGLWSQIIAIFSALIASLLTYNFNQTLLSFIKAQFNGGDLYYFILGLAFPILLFVLVYYLTAGLLNIVKKIILNALELRLSDRIFGFISSLVLGSLIVLLLILVLEWFSYKMNNELKAKKQSDHIENFMQLTSQSLLYSEYKNALLFICKVTQLRLLPENNQIIDIDVNAILDLEEEG